jgi:hypothetical protein
MYYVKKKNSHEWDFPEKTGMRLYKGAHVHRIPDSSAREAYTRLQVLIKYTHNIIAKLENNHPRDPGVELLKRYHKGSMCDIREMPPVAQLHFKGINKPKGVHVTNEHPVGKDNNLRAKKRVIFVELRNINTGNWIPMDKVVDTLVHELAHTYCNHVVWREDDHGKDFKIAKRKILNNN